ncbi:MAG: helix-turn-helix transcriptional regulator [Clostridia bacterium]|nr:helix-turn-helix transcriptional regulator [Clostridia bacterium]
MSLLRENIAKNIVDLRKKNNWTQAELAEKLNYSDKAISKWERGESIPDIEIMAQMSELFGVSLDYFCTDLDGEAEADRKRSYPSGLFTKRILQILLWVVTLFFLGTVVFVYQKIGGNEWSGLWICFIWPVPASCLLSTVLFYRFRMHKAVPFALSATLWTLLAALFLQGIVLNTNLWLVFLIGVPLQIIIFLAFWLRLGSFSDDGKGNDT